MKIYIQRGAASCIGNQVFDFLFGNNFDYHQRGNAFLELVIAPRENGKDFNNLGGDGNIDEPMRLLNNAFAYSFRNVALSRAGGEEIEVGKHCGHISTTMKILTGKHGDLLSYVDKNDESQSVIKVHHYIRYLPIMTRKWLIEEKPSAFDALANIWLCETIEKITKYLGLHLNLKTAEIQDFFKKTIGDHIDKSPNTLYLYVLVFNPDPATQSFKESITNSFTLTFESWTTERRTVNTTLDYQFDIKSSSDLNSPNL